VDPRVGMDDLEKRKFLTISGLKLRPLRRPARSQSLYRLRDPGSWGVKGGGRVRLTTLPPSVSRLSIENVGASTSHNPMGFHGLLQGR
jgi:hypothetical protein